MSATVERATTQAYDRFQIWFGSAQDRAEQWFQLHIRLTTITAAALTAVLLQLDTPEIFRLMRDRPILVENLAKAAPGVSEQSKSVIDQTSAARQAEGMNIAGKLRQENFETLQKNLAETGFNFLPSKFLGRWDEDAGEIPEWARSIHPKLAHLLVHLFGLLLSVVLLTLGAPLWFNLLKNLMSLRPAVATLSEKRPLSAPDLPASPTTPPVAN
jgi:hypothetical protein